MPALDRDESIRATVQMPPMQLEQILVHERTTEDIVIQLVKRKRYWRTYELMAICFAIGVALGLATVSIS
jgi:hypothetical protein